MRIGIIRLQAQRFFKLGDRVIQPSGHLRPGVAQVVVRPGIIRLQAQRLFILGDRVIQPPGHLRPGEAQVVMRPCVVWPFGHRVAPDGQYTAVILVAPCREHAQSERQRCEHHPALPPDRRVNPHRGKCRHRCQRQVHPVFDDHLDRTGHQAGWSQDHKKPGTPKTPCRPAPERDEGRRHQRDDDKGVRRHFAAVVHPERAVFKHQRMGPHRKPQITGDRFELGQPVRPRRDANVQAGRAAAIPTRACHQPDQWEPGCRQRHVQSPTPAPGLPKRARHKGPVIKQHDQRRGNHHFFGGHAEEAGSDGEGKPAASGAPVCFGSSDEAIQGEQVA